MQEKVYQHSRTLDQKEGNFLILGILSVQKGNGPRDRKQARRKPRRRKSKGG